MQSTGHDANLALHAGADLPGHVLDVVVLTSDSGLLATLREASGPEHALWHAPSADVAVDLLVGGRCGVLIADLSSLGRDAAPFFDRLHAQFPELVLLAAGRREEEGAVASLVGSGLIYRLLHKPVSPARAQLFIAAATRRYYELRDSEPIGMAAVKTTGPRPRRSATFLALAVVAALAAAFLGWRHLSIQPPPSQLDVAHAPTEQIATLLGRAQIAFARGQLSEPRGDNALEHYREALALDPGHREAAEGVQRVLAALEARVIAALRARDAAQAFTALSALRDAEPRYPGLDHLHAELIALSRSAALQRSEAASASPPQPASLANPPPAAGQAPEQTADATPPTDIEQASDAERAADEFGDSGVETETLDAPLAEPSADATPEGPDEAALREISELRARGALAPPAEVNAFDSLMALRMAHPQSPQVEAEAQRLAFALLEHARTELAGRRLDEASATLDRVEALMPGLATTRALRQQLESALEERAFATNIVQAAQLKRVREAPVVYPRDAQRDGVEGWVDVEFTIAPDGSTQDLVVRAAEPRDVFEAAALDSVRRMRFEPVLRDGRPVRQRAVLRVRFVLE